MPTLTQVPPAAPPESMAARVAAYQRDLEADPAAVRAAVEVLSDEELVSQGLRPYQLNYLSLFGEAWPPEQVQAAARAAIRHKIWRGWEFYAGMRRVSRALAAPGIDAAAAAPGFARLEGWDEVLRVIDREPGPVALCTLHLGAFRDAPFELALLGRRVTMPANTEGYEQTQNALAESHAVIRERWKPTNVDYVSGTVAMARAAKRGELLFAYVDGNTGSDGPWGTQGRTQVDFVGFRVRVKDGMARLAAGLGATVLPLVTPWEGDWARVVAGSPIRPGGRLKGGAQDAFAASATQALYAFFDPFVRAAPADWESACFLHRWREPATADAAGAGDHVSADGATLRLDRRRVVAIDDSRAPVLLNVQSLRSFRVPEWAADAYAALIGDGLAVPSGGASPGRDAGDPLVGFLTHLVRHGMVVTV
jgi:lauroyl/myristoyl acyltransferase